MEKLAARLERIVHGLGQEVELWVSQGWLLSDMSAGGPFRVRAELSSQGTPVPVEYARTCHHDRHCFTRSFAHDPQTFNVWVWWGKFQGFNLPLDFNSGISFMNQELTIQRRVDEENDNCAFYDDIRFDLESQKSWTELAKLRFKSHRRTLFLAEGHQSLNVPRDEDDPSQDDWWTEPLLSKLPLLDASNLALMRDLLRLTHEFPARFPHQPIAQHYKGPQYDNA